MKSTAACAVGKNNTAAKRTEGTGGFILKGAAAMTLFSLVNKLIGVFLRLFLSNRIGSEGMGVYQLIMSVYTMFSTFATAGLTVSVSRLVAEKDETSGEDSYLLFRSSFSVALLISAAATVALLICADSVAFEFLGDGRCAPPLKILAFSMPFMAAAACFKGWFIAKRRVIITSGASLFEEIIKISVIAVMLCFFYNGVNDILKLCEGIVWGVTLSEAASCTYLFLFCTFSGEKSTASASKKKNAALRKELVAVSAPISVSVCLTAILHTAETILIPYVFESYSGDRTKALSDFGMIRGMAIPLIFFPFAFLSSLVSVFTPEISRLNARDDKDMLAEKIKTLMAFVSVSSIAAGGLFVFQSNVIGDAFYPGCKTGEAIRILATVTPFMYIETVADGLLKAIGEQKRTMLYTVLNSVLRMVLIVFLVSGSGETGYLIMLVISNTFAYLLCRIRLGKVTGVYPNLLLVLFSVAAAAVSGFASEACLALLPAGMSRFGSAFAVSAVYSGVFVLAVSLVFCKRINSFIGEFFKRG